MSVPSTRTCNCSGLRLPTRRIARFFASPSGGAGGCWLRAVCVGGQWVSARVSSRVARWVMVLVAGSGSHRPPGRDGSGWPAVPVGRATHRGSWPDRPHRGDQGVGVGIGVHHRSGRETPHPARGLHPSHNPPPKPRITGRPGTHHLHRRRTPTTRSAHKHPAYPTQPGKQPAKTNPDKITIAPRMDLDTASV